MHNNIIIPITWTHNLYIYYQDMFWRISSLQVFYLCYGYCPWMHALGPSRREHEYIKYCIKVHQVFGKVAKLDFYIIYNDRGIYYTWNILCYNQGYRFIYECLHCVSWQCNQACSLVGERGDLQSLVVAILPLGNLIFLTNANTTVCTTL